MFYIHVLKILTSNTEILCPDLWLDVKPNTYFMIIHMKLKFQTFKFHLPNFN
jgi:hypothetical protein